MSDAVVKMPVRGSTDKGVASTNLEQVNILVVDDLPEKILAYEAILAELGQNLVAVRSGEEALKLVLQQEFAVILLDVNMPGMDGFETAALIRQRKKSSHIPIIFLTAFTDEVRMAQGYASGAVDYLPTPVVPETLKAKVKVFIELSQMRRQAALQAEERALRQAAEESARRSEFLVMASTVFTSSQNEQEILGAVTQLPIPFLADTSILWMCDKELKKDWIGWTSSQAGKHVYSHSGLDVVTVFPMLESIIKQVMETGHSKYLPSLAASALVPVQQNNINFSKLENEATHLMVLVVPFPIRAKPCGVLILARSGVALPYLPIDISLATDFVSRAGASLENVMLVKRIREADQRKNEFLAMLAHELRNPLAPIRNALYVMRMSSDSIMRTEAEEMIERQLKHLVHLVDDLMDISRITQGKIELRKELVSLNDAINQAVETAQELIKQRGQILTVDMPEQAILLNADFGRISQIFANLLNNAAKYTDNGGRIDVIATTIDNNAVITIRDNGIGIPEDMAMRIFEMFLQVDSSLERAQGGLGIGLTLVKNLVEMHGGTIKVHSNGANQGSDFIVTLPAAHEIAQVEIIEQAVNEKSKNILKVLIVDDNIESAKTLGWMIEDIFGHATHLEHNGKNAIEYCRNHQPDVILLDIGLPGMNGYEICKAMRELPAMKNTTFIAQTGWGQEEHRQRSKEAGFHFHLVKPIDIKVLEKLIMQLAEEHKIIAETA